VQHEDKRGTVKGKRDDRAATTNLVAVHASLCIYQQINARTDRTIKHNATLLLTCIVQTSLARRSWRPRQVNLSCSTHSSAVTKVLLFSQNQPFKYHVQVDPKLFFQRLVVAGRSIDDMATMFRFVLCRHPPALFEESLMLRELQQFVLAETIWCRLAPDIAGPNDEVQYTCTGLLSITTWHPLSMWIFHISRTTHGVL